MDGLVRSGRYGAAAAGVAALVFTTGYYLQMPWATRTWPWPDGRLSYIFIASILAAMGVEMIWLGLSAERGTVVGGALTLGVAASGWAVWLLKLSLRSPERHLLSYAAGFAILACCCLAALLLARRYPIRDFTPMPRLVRVSFWLFTGILVGAGLALIFEAPAIFPWALKPESSVMFGWTFLGAAAAFGYAGTRRGWQDARGQLLGFLAYDLILLVPFLRRFSSVPPDHLPSLAIYTAAVVYSGLLAVYYLFLDRRTRGWVMRTARPAGPARPRYAGGAGSSGSGG